MFTLFNWSVVSSSFNQGLVSAAFSTPTGNILESQGSQNIFSYFSEDDIATITSDNYFLEIAAKQLFVDDWILVTAEDGSIILQVSTITKEANEPATGITTIVLFGGIDNIVPVQNDIVALAGGGQADATQLIYGINNVTTVATNGDSVALPQAVEGASLVVMNFGASVLDVYTQTGSDDTINDELTTDPVSMNPGQILVFYALENAPGEWQVDLHTQVPAPVEVMNNITAHAGGGGSSAVQLIYGLNNVTIVASNYDSVQLPAAVEGTTTVVMNNGVNILSVFTHLASGDFINGESTLTPVLLNPGQKLIFYALTDTPNGEWEVDLNIPAIYDFQIASVALNAAEFMGLYATPIQIIPAPPTGYSNFISSVQVNSLFVTTAYADGGDLGLQYGNTAHLAGAAASDTIPETTIYAVTAVGGTVSIGPVQLQTTYTATNGVAIYISNAAGAYTTGDGTFVITVRYYTLPILT